MGAHLGFVAVYIKAEVMKWVYTAGTKRKLHQIPKPAKPSATAGFLSSLYSSLARSSTPSRVASPSRPVVELSVNALELNHMGVSLSIFSATAQVNLDKKMISELVRSTKKNPPSKVKFELIYVSRRRFIQFRLTNFVLDFQG